MLTPWGSILHSREKGTVWDHLRPDDLWIEGIQVLQIPWFSSVRLPVKRCYQTPRQIPPPNLGLGHPVWRVLDSCGPPWPGRAIKLFFSTSSQPLSLGFNFASVHRGQVSASVCAQAFSQHSNQRSTLSFFACLCLLFLHSTVSLTSAHIFIYWLFPTPTLQSHGAGALNAVFTATHCHVFSTQKISDE